MDCYNNIASAVSSLPVELAQKGKAAWINLRYGIMSLRNETVEQLIV